MIFQFIRSGMLRNRTYLASSFLLCCSITAANVSFAADRLEITDEYLQGLSEEISSPEYVTQAKEELRQTEKQELALDAPSAKITRALTNIKSFESLMKSEYPASYKIYSELTTTSRKSVFVRFYQTKKLSMAKRLIIDLYLKL